MLNLCKVKSFGIPKWDLFEFNCANLPGDKNPNKIQTSKGWSQRLMALSVKGWTELAFCGTKPN